MGCLRSAEKRTARKLGAQRKRRKSGIFPDFFVSSCDIPPKTASLRVKGPFEELIPWTTTASSSCFLPGTRGLSEVVSCGETPEGALIPGGTRPAGGPPEANQVQETGQPAHYDVIYGEGE